MYVCTVLYEHCPISERNFWSLLRVHVQSIVRFESGKKATFWNPPPPPVEILSDKSSILPIAMKVGSKDAGESPASFALLFVKNYAILDLSDKISAGGWWIPKCCFFTALKSDNAQFLNLMKI